MERGGRGAVESWEGQNVRGPSLLEILEVVGVRVVTNCPCRPNLKIADIPVENCYVVPMDGTADILSLAAPQSSKVLSHVSCKEPNWMPYYRMTPSLSNITTCRLPDC